MSGPREDAVAPADQERLHAAARIVFGRRPWRVIPGRTPRVGASCARPYCWKAAAVMIERDGNPRPQSVCSSCATLLTAGAK